MITRRVFGVTCCAAAMVAAGCGSGTASGNPSPSSASQSSTALPTHAQTCAATTYDRLTEPERIGQLFLIGMPTQGGPGADVLNAIKTYHFGSALFVGNTVAGVRQVRAETDAVQRLAPPGVRLFVATNQEGGEIQPLRGPGFAAIPPATVQGTMPAGTLEKDATTWGRELEAAGVNLNLAPVLDVVPAGTESTNAPIGALQREYGTSPGPVAAHGVAFIQGMRAAGVATTAKHFPGLGRVRGNTDFTANVVDTTTTSDDPYLRPYQAAIGAGVPFVMIALARYTRIDPANLAAFSAKAVTSLLTDRMGFRGVIVSDDLGAAAVSDIPVAERAIGFLNAGGDMITDQSADVAEQMAAAVRQKTASDPEFRKRAGSAVMQILDAKAEYGLLTC